jgi:hypothetical protein
LNVGMDDPSQRKVFSAVEGLDKKNIALEQGSQTQIDWRATFQQKDALRATV